MRPSRFDTFTRWTGQRLSRRAAVTGASAGPAATRSSASLGRVSAQEATPIATQSGEVMLLFVQNAGLATLTPGEGTLHTLTMTEVTDQTLYFSDRPNRIAGMMPTAELLVIWEEAFVDSAPNAVVIGQSDTGEEAVVVVLQNPVYDAAAGTLSYQVEILQGDRIADRTFEQEPLTELDAPRDYTRASLFIDDAGTCAACIFGFVIFGMTAGCDDC